LVHSSPCIRSIAPPWVYSCTTILRWLILAVGWCISGVSLHAPAVFVEKLCWFPSGTPEALSNFYLWRNWRKWVDFLWVRRRPCRIFFKKRVDSLRVRRRPSQKNVVRPTKPISSVSSLAVFLLWSFSYLEWLLFGHTWSFSTQGCCFCGENCVDFLWVRRRPCPNSQKPRVQSLRVRRRPSPIFLRDLSKKDLMLFSFGYAGGPVKIVNNTVLISFGYAGGPAQKF
jgi:hypothetical protein